MQTIESTNSMQNLSAIVLPENWNDAISTGCSAFDELFGNCGNVYGARRGKIILLSAQSGTGKTRLSLKIGSLMTKINPEIVYGHYTGEQSVIALAIMANSMGIELNSNMLADTSCYWPEIEMKIIQNNVNVVVIDSFPMLQFPLNNRVPLDTKAKVGLIASFAAKHNISIILLNHTDKRGNRGGRNELLHLVDVAYTMRSVIDKYDGIKVVEFHCDKNREGSPVSRAFPFSGEWDLENFFELENGNSNETGADNESKVAKRKLAIRENLLNAIKNLGGVLERACIQDGSFEVENLPTSSLMVLLRNLTEEKILTVTTTNTGNKGTRPIKCWTLVQ